MRKFVSAIRNMPWSKKVFLFLLGPIGIVGILICYMMDAAYQLEDRINAVIESPNEETVIELMSFLNSTILGFSHRRFELLMV